MTVVAEAAINVHVLAHHDLVDVRVDVENVHNLVLILFPNIRGGVIVPARRRFEVGREFAFVDLDVRPNISHAVISPQVLQYLLGACLIDFWPPLRLNRVLLVIVLAHVEQLDDRVVDDSISECHPAEDQHDFLVGYDRLPGVVNPPVALSILFILAGLATVGRAQEIFVSQVPPWLKSSVFILYHLFGLS